MKRQSETFIYRKTKMFRFVPIFIILCVFTPKFYFTNDTEQWQLYPIDDDGDAENPSESIINTTMEIFCNAKFYVHFFVYVEASCTSLIPDNIIRRISACLNSAMIVKRLLIKFVTPLPMIFFFPNERSCF